MSSHYGGKNKGNDNYHQRNYDRNSYHSGGGHNSNPAAQKVQQRHLVYQRNIQSLQKTNDLRIRISLGIGKLNSLLVKDPKKFEDRIEAFNKFMAKYYHKKEEIDRLRYAKIDETNRQKGKERKNPQKNSEKEVEEESNEEETTGFGEKPEEQEKDVPRKVDYSRKAQEFEKNLEFKEDPAKLAQILSLLRKTKIASWIGEPYNLLLFRSDFASFMISTEDLTKEITHQEFSNGLDMIVRALSSNRDFLFVPFIPQGGVVADKYFRYLKKNFGFCCSLESQNLPELPEFHPFNYSEKHKNWLKNLDTAQPNTFTPFLSDLSNQNEKIRIYKFTNYYENEVPKENLNEKPKKKGGKNPQNSGEVKEEFEILETNSTKEVDQWVSENVEDEGIVAVDLEWDCGGPRKYPDLVQVWAEKEIIKENKKPIKKCNCLLFSTTGGEKCSVQLVEKVFLNQKVKKILCGMSEDIRKLQDWFYFHFSPEEYEFYGSYEAPMILKEFKKFNFIDFDHGERGAAYICERFLGQSMKKNLKARLSDWTSKFLTKEQVFYALEDTAFLYKSYKVLSQLVFLSDDEHAKTFFLPMLKNVENPNSPVSNSAAAFEKVLFPDALEEKKEMDEKYMKMIDEMKREKFEEILVNQNHIHWTAIHSKYN